MDVCVCLLGADGRMVEERHFNEHVDVKITAVARGCKKYTPLVARHETNKL
jgi:hypothetical protein